VRGKLRLEHCVRHIEPVPRPLHHALVKALLDGVGDDRLNGSETYWSQMRAER
jgi:hypothetical protein